ncbi:MAG: hypothetical protein AB1714_13780, partial [Acidobacteriota bacterium]
MKPRWLVGLVAIGLIAVAPVVNAQQSQGQIYGSVEDETGGVLPEACFTLHLSCFGVGDSVQSSSARLSNLLICHRSSAICGADW